MEKYEIWIEKMKKKIFNFFIFIPLENIFILWCSLIFWKAKYAIHFIESLITMEIWMVEGVVVDPYLSKKYGKNRKKWVYQDPFNHSYFYNYEILDKINCIFVFPKDQGTSWYRNIFKWNEDEEVENFLLHFFTLNSIFFQNILW